MARSHERDRSVAWQLAGQVRGQYTLHHAARYSTDGFGNSAKTRTLVIVVLIVSSIVQELHQCVERVASVRVQPNHRVNITRHVVESPWTASGHQRVHVPAPIQSLCRQADLLDGKPCGFGDGLDRGEVLAAIEAARDLEQHRIVAGHPHVFKSLGHVGILALPCRSRLHRPSVSNLRQVGRPTAPLDERVAPICRIARDRRTDGGRIRTRSCGGYVTCAPSRCALQRREGAKHRERGFGGRDGRLDRNVLHPRSLGGSRSAASGLAHPSGEQLIDLWARQGSVDREVQRPASPAQ
jgi:hypothetical protein